VKDGDTLFDRLLSRGNAVIEQVSADLMSNPHFLKAMQQALKGKQVLDLAVARALKNMSIPTRTEFKKALGRIEALETRLAALEAKPPTRKRRAPRAKAAARRPAAGPAAPGEGGEQ
jgi:polyhydroxyalkanoate synthesis regulator phasin